MKTQYHVTKHLNISTLNPILRQIVHKVDIDENITLDILIDDISYCEKDALILNILLYVHGDDQRSLKRAMEMIKKVFILHKDAYQVLSKHVIEIKNVIATPSTLSKSLPIEPNKFNFDGTLLGLAKDGKVPYVTNFKSTNNCKNIAIIGKGASKTFLAINWLIDAYASGFNLFMTGRVGKELNELIKYCNGLCLSMSTNCYQYINTFVIKKRETRNPVMYFNKCFKRSVKMLLILANLKPEVEERGEVLLEEFLQSVYLCLGVLPGNPNTWYRTESLNPHKIYELFVNYLSKEVRLHYSSVVENMLLRFQRYLDKRKGCNCNFQIEYSVDELMHYNAIRFDLSRWSLEEGQDPRLMNLNLFYVDIIQEEFFESKRRNKQWTINLVEEYPQGISNGNSQYIVNILLTNDIRKLTSKAISKLDLIALGQVSKAEEEYILNELDIEAYPLKKNQFVLINHMDQNKVILETFIPKDHTPLSL
ncbi:hypothetical protein [Vallitalea okinawensis]|uniref:hypothetical protein n=1 Tax=Vallitalea okinawensis TaxID=2078660 RepID=UPI000CFD62D0|nr:hypothetical protein [Vallitalea okinawensis]